MFGLNKKKSLLSDADQEKIVQCIVAAEAQTTGEIRVYVESKCSNPDAIDRAKKLFEELNMSLTIQRNAVLVYMAIDDRKFAIIGDEAIYTKAGGASFWEAAASVLKTYLQQGKIGEGLSVCVTELGNALAQHFPYDPAITKNELPDEIVFGK